MAPPNEVLQDTAPDPQTINLRRDVPKVVLGQRVIERQRMDPDMHETVQTAHTGLSPQECDRVRAERAGEQYISIDEAEKRRRLRPAKSEAQHKTLREELVDLVRGAPADEVASAQAGESADRAEIGAEHSDAAIDRQIEAEQRTARSKGHFPDHRLEPVGKEDPEEARRRATALHTDIESKD